MENTLSLLSIILALLSIALFMSLFLFFNEKEDEVTRDRSKNKPTWIIKLYSKIKKIPLTSGANAKWYEPLEDYTASYYPAFMKKPNHRERFMYSSTLFVFVTDSEHWYQFIKLRFATFAVAANGVFLNAFLPDDWHWLWGYVILLATAQAGLWSFSFIKEAFIKTMN